jgi:hypothetical protein
MERQESVLSEWRFWHSMSKNTQVILNHQWHAIYKKTTKLTDWLFFFQINARWHYFRKLILLYHPCPKCATPHSATPFWQLPHWLLVWRCGTRPVSVLLLSSTPYHVVQRCAEGRHYGLVPFFIIFLNPSVEHFPQAPCFVVPCPALGRYILELSRIYFFLCRWHGCSDRVGRAMLFSEADLWDVSGMRLCEGFVEFMCGCTIRLLGNTVGCLPFYPSSELEITSIVR